MDMDWLFEAFGWLGSILIVWSLMQARVLRFRVMNLAGALIATIYNAAIGIWPFAAMNAAIVVIDVYWLARLLRERHDGAVYEVVEVREDDAYLQHVLRVHADDIRKLYPMFVATPTDGGAPRTVLLVLRGDETVGVVAVRDTGGGSGQVELDWVSPRFRDFTPGEFVYRSSGVFASKGFADLVVDPEGHNEEYLRRVGFQPDGTAWRMRVPA